MRACFCAYLEVVFKNQNFDASMVIYHLEKPLPRKSLPSVGSTVGGGYLLSLFNASVVNGCSILADGSLLNQGGNC